MIVTIDGPAGAGKSTIAKSLAKKLNISYLDTGSMYRAVTLKALKLEVDLSDEAQLVEMARNSTLEMRETDLGQEVILDGENITDDIRLPEVTNNTSFIASKASVREIVVGWQREIGEKQSFVIEGRDIGTVVFPKAQYKFYLDADIHERAKRRKEEIENKGEKVDSAQLTEEMVLRDKRDSERESSPLCKADDAVTIDSTHLNIDEVVSQMLKVING